MHSIKKIVATNGAFAALRKDSSCIIWGSSFCDGDTFGRERVLTQNVLDVTSNGSQFSVRLIKPEEMDVEITLEDLREYVRLYSKQLFFF